jgi:hypothetical protein
MRNTLSGVHTRLASLSGPHVLNLDLTNTPAPDNNQHLKAHIASYSSAFAEVCIHDE